MRWHAEYIAERRNEQSGRVCHGTVCGVSFRLQTDDLRINMRISNTEQHFARGSRPLATCCHTKVVFDVCVQFPETTSWPLVH